MLHLSLLLLSFIGYFLALFIYKKGKGTALYPAIVVSTIVVIGFLAGLINQMEAVYMLTFGIGLLLLVGLSFAVVFRKFSLPDCSLTSILPLLLFCLGFFTLHLIFNGRFLFSYDDFSHWGQAAQVISINQRLPIPEDGLIFTSYPVGSSLFIAYGAVVLGCSADTYLFMQALLLWAFYLSMLSATNKPWGQLIIAFLIMLFMQYNITLESLSVDNLLSAAAIAGFMICVDSDKSLRNMFAELALVLSALTLLKNSGFFLAIILLGYMLFLCRKNKNFKREMIWLLLPFAVIILWNVHVSTTFTNASKHAVSITYYHSILADKRRAGIRTTLGIILPLLFKPSTNHALLLIPGYLLSLILLYKRNRLAQTKSIFLFAGVLLIVYEIGVMAMYVLSMPTEEVIYQNGQDYYRYNGTVIAILAAILIYLLCNLLPEKLYFKPIKNAIVALACCSLICLNVIFVLSLELFLIEPVETRRETSSTAAKLMQISKDNAFPTDASFVILYDMPDTAGYHYFVSGFYLKTYDIIHCYDQATATKEYTENPEKYYINLNTGELFTPKE